LFIESKACTVCFAFLDTTPLLVLDVPGFDAVGSKKYHRLSYTY